MVLHQPLKLRAKQEPGPKFHRDAQQGVRHRDMLSAASAQHSPRRVCNGAQTLRMREEEDNAVM